jgi:anti-anti-sigma regulatory factor
MDWMSSLNITTEVLQARVPVTVFHLEGRLNLSTINILKQAAQKAYKKGGRHFLLDLKAVPSLSSAGLQEILTIYKMLDQPSSTEKMEPSPTLSEDRPSRSSFLKILNPSPDIMRVLRTAGFDSYIDVFENLQEALTAF